MAAFLIDLVVHVAIWVFFFFNLHFNDYLAWLAAAVYLLIKDGLHNGQSLGKLLLKIRVVQASDQGHISVLHSIKRNAILVVPFVLRFLPFWGSLMLILILSYEGFLIFTQAEGQRWGDQFADTIVVNA